MCVLWRITQHQIVLDLPLWMGKFPKIQFYIELNAVGNFTFLLLLSNTFCKTLTYLLHQEDPERVGDGQSDGVYQILWEESFGWELI